MAHAHAKVVGNGAVALGARRHVEFAVIVVKAQAKRHAQSANQLDRALVEQSRIDRGRFEPCGKRNVVACKGYADGRLCGQVGTNLRVEVVNALAVECDGAVGAQ